MRNTPKAVLSIAFAGAFLVSCGKFDPGDVQGISDNCGEKQGAPDIGPWDTTFAAFEQRVLELTNAQRAQGGCCGSGGCFSASPALLPNANLQTAARLHAKDMATRNYFSHDSPDGDTLLDRARAAGFAGCTLGENIAQGQTTPEEVVDSWMQSSRHCQNILSANFTALGVGYFDDASAPQRYVWVEDFGK